MRQSYLIPLWIDYIGDVLPIHLEADHLSPDIHQSVRLRLKVHRAVTNHGDVGALYQIGHIQIPNARLAFLSVIAEDRALGLQLP